MKKDFLKTCNRIVVKVGTNSITNQDGFLDMNKMEHLVEQLVELQKMGYQMILVTSGAVGCGHSSLHLPPKMTMAQKQASAAVGQVLLMKHYYEMMAKHHQVMGQVLLTKDDMSHRDRHLNAKQTLNALIEMGVIPVINENDTTVVDEIKVGDNDNLSALVSILVEADLLVLLSDVDGIYDKHPSHEGAKRLEVIEHVDDQIMSYASGKGSKYSTGGMITKLEAAKKVNSAGIHMVIADSRHDCILKRIVSGEFVGSLFLASTRHLIQRKKWLLVFPEHKGVIEIDEGAKQAIHLKQSSLLMVGMTQTTGTYLAGDVVLITNANQVIAKGIAKYDHDFIEAAIKQEADLGVLIHRDYLVLVEE